MKTKTFKMNALLGVLVTVFAVLFFSAIPSPAAQAGQPATAQKQPGFSVERTLPVPAPTDTTVPVVVAPADPVPPAPPVVVDMDWLLNKQNAIASLVMLLLTFFSKWVPGLKEIGDTGKRALVAGLTVITGFVAVKYLSTGDVKIADLLSLFLTYLVNSVGYDKALKPAGLRTPKVKA